jgi:hypothetical protein
MRGQYIGGAGFANDPKAVLFQTGATSHRQSSAQANAYGMIQRRAQSADVTTRVGNHTFRATGVSAYMKNGGTLEKAAQDGEPCSLAVKGHLQPSLHARMETAEIVHDAGPFQNCPTSGASREINVEAPVCGGRRMLEDIGIHPLNDVVHMQHLGRRCKRQIVNFDLMNPRLGSWRGRTKRKNRERQYSSRQDIQSNHHKSATSARSRVLRRASHAP